MPKVICKKIGCKKLVEKGINYGVKWKRLRESVLSRDNYLCQDCLASNRLVAAEEVHHIIEVKEDWNKRYEEDNLISLCKSCHRKRHTRKFF